MTTSRTCAIPASMDDGCASIVVERAYTELSFLEPTRLDGSAPAAPPVPPTTFLRWIRHDNGRSRCVCSGLAQRSTGRQPIARFCRSAPQPRSDQLGCPQMGQPELELAFVEFVGARFPRLLLLEGRYPLPAALHGLEAVEGCTGHGAPGCTIYQQARAAEAIECLEVGQHGRLIEFDALIESIWRQLHPRRPSAGALTGAVI